jgi:hypothetical protein
LIGFGISDPANVGLRQNHSPLSQAYLLIVDDLERKGETRLRSIWNDGPMEFGDLLTAVESGGSDPASQIHALVERLWCKFNGNPDSVRSVVRF